MISAVLFLALTALPVETFGYGAGDRAGLIRVAASGPGEGAGLDAVINTGTQTGADMGRGK